MTEQTTPFYKIALAEIAGAVTAGITDAARQPTPEDLSAFIALFEPDFSQVLGDRPEAKWRVNGPKLRQLARDIAGRAESYSVQADGARVTLDLLHQAWAELKGGCRETGNEEALDPQAEYCRRVPIDR